jgi:hypothetical protein
MAMAKVVLDPKGLPHRAAPMPGAKPAISVLPYKDCGHPEEVEQFRKLIREIRRLHFFWVLFLGTFGAASLGLACTSIDLPAKEVKKRSVAVFRGTIREYRDSADGSKITVFEVSRVWKGHVGRVFELSTFPGFADTGCSFGSTALREIGSDVVVFARKDKTQGYLIGYWDGTRTPTDQDLRDLGPGIAP